MKKITSPVIYFFSFLLKIIIFPIRAYFRFLSKEYRFIKLSPNKKGYIYYFDKNKKKTFSVKSRNFIDSVTADQIFTQNDYDINFLSRGKEIKKTYDQIVSSGRDCIIIDCGANIGLSARYFAEEFPKAKIIAIEPNYKNYSLAIENCNDFSNVDVRHCAIGSSEGYVTIENSDADDNAFRTIKSESQKEIKMISINQILNEFEGAELLITKIDIEGFEEDLFSANTQWVNNSFLIIIELHDWCYPKQAKSKSFLKVISSKNRDFIYRNENIFSISNDTDHNSLP